MAQDNLARKFDPDEQDGEQNDPSRRHKPTPSSRLTGKEGNVYNVDFGSRPADGTFKPGAGSSLGKEDYYKNLKGKQNTDALNQGPQQAQPGQQNKTGPAANEAKSKPALGGKAGAGGKAELAQDLNKGFGEIKAAASDPNLSVRQKLGATKDAAVKTAGDTIARQYVSKQTGGLVDAKVGTVLTDLQKKGLIAGTRSLLTNVKIFGVQLWIWLVTIVALQLMIWGMLIIVIISTVAAACEATGFKIFGVPVFHEAAGIFTGIDVKGLCEPLTAGLNKLAGGVGGGGTPSSGCDINQDLCKPETIKAEGDKYGCNWDPEAMSRICTHESNGVPKMSGTDRCAQQITDPEIRKYMREGYLSWSGGLWQIDIFTASSSRFPACAGLIEPKDTSDDGTGSQFIQSKGSCVPGHWKGNYCDLRKCGLKPGKTEQDYAACVRALLTDIDQQYKIACEKFKSQGYSAWPDSAQKCGVQ